MKPCPGCRAPIPEIDRLCPPCLRHTLSLLARSIPKALAAQADALARKAAS